MNKRDFILKYIEMNNNKIDIKEATEDIDVLFHTLKNVLIAQGNFFSSVELLKCLKEREELLAILGPKNLWNFLQS